jgi:hypothetical protein
MLKPLTLDQLWILSSQGLSAPYPTSHSDSSAARDNRGILVGTWRQRGGSAPNFLPPGSCLNPTSSRWLSPPDLVLHWKKQTGKRNGMTGEVAWKGQTQILLDTFCWLRNPGSSFK